MRTEVRRAPRLAAWVITAAALLGVSSPATAQSTQPTPVGQTGEDPTPGPVSQFVSVPLTFAADQPTPRTPQEQENNGEDDTRPLTRVDLRPRYERLSSGRDLWMFMLRAEKPFVLNDRWQVATRFDAPLELKDISTTATDYKAGLGDFFAQALLVDQVDDRSAFAVGTRVIFPTATQDDLGDGKLQLVPTVAYRYFIDEVATAASSWPPRATRSTSPATTAARTSAASSSRRS